MKLLIIGDSHGNVANLKHVMGYGIKIKAGAVIHTGDWSNFDNIKTVTDFGIPLYSCLGNADIDPRFEFEEFLKFEIEGLPDGKAGVKIGVIHNIKKLKESKENFDVIFCGHNHKQNQKGNIINPGALENDINFAVFDTKTKGVEFVNHD